MLRVKQVASYSVPKYPREIFALRREPAALTLVKRGATSAALIAMLESCDRTLQPTAGVPSPPPLLTENEARSIITDVFNRNGIHLRSDVPMFIDVSSDMPDSQPPDFVLDGYNDSLRVGYEYIAGNDRSTFTNDMIEQIKAATADSGPYTKTTFEQWDPDYLEEMMQAFIDTLKAHGKI